MGPTASSTPADAIPNAQAIAGVWALQQIDSRAHLRRLEPSIERALAVPGVKGFSMRVPWNAIDRDSDLLDEGRRLAERMGKAFTLRFMAGRHTPGRVFEAGSPFYLKGNERIPRPFLADGSPNFSFEGKYAELVARLADWCRANEVRLLHLAWYGQDWAELNHGKEVRALEGYSYESWLEAHKRLVDIGLRHADKSLAVELPFSGYGPCTQAASDLADHVIETIGPTNPLFFCQANGWGPTGEWGAPNAGTEAAFDRVWEKPICRGLQSIQPEGFAWAEIFGSVYDTKATYCEIYVPSFSQEPKAALLAEITRFAQHCAEQAPLPDR